MTTQYHHDFHNKPRTEPFLIVQDREGLRNKSYCLECGREHLEDSPCESTTYATKFSYMKKSPTKVFSFSVFFFKFSQLFSAEFVIRLMECQRPWLVKRRDCTEKCRQRWRTTTFGVNCRLLVSNASSQRRTRRNVPILTLEICGKICTLKLPTETYIILIPYLNLSHNLCCIHTV